MATGRARVGRPLLAQALTGVVLLLVVAVVVGGDQGEVRSDCVTVQVNSSIEASKVHVLTRAAAAYNAEGRTPGGACGEVRVDDTSSGLAAEALRHGWDADTVGAPEPDVWAPTSSMWLDLLHHWGAPEGLPQPDEAPSITQSPLVIAMLRPMAEALGWPEQPVRWGDILALANSPDGWAAEGHPEWGRFSFGKDDSRRSTSGLAATLATFYAATGKSSDLQLADLVDPEARRFVVGVEAGVHHYADDAIEFLDTMAGYDARGEATSYVSAVVLEEQLIHEYNRGAYEGGARPEVPLVPLYPADGTLMLDHPYVVLPAASDAQRLVAEDFYDYLRDGERQALLADAGFRSRDEGAEAWVLADGARRAMGGAEVVEESSVVSPPSGEVLARMLDVWAELRRPASVLLVLDTSGSMEEPAGQDLTRLDVVRRAALEGIDHLHDRHEIGLWAFSSDTTGSPDAPPPVRELVPLSPLGEARPRLIEQIEGLVPDGGTPLYHTVRRAHDWLAERLDPGRINAVVVLTDGVNEYPPDSDLVALLEDIDALRREQAGEASVRIFTIAFSDEASFEVMEDVASRTRAQAFDATDPATIDQVFVDVLSNV